MSESLSWNMLLLLIQPCVSCVVCFVVDRRLLLSSFVWRRLVVVEDMSVGVCLVDSVRTVVVLWVVVCV